VDLLLVRRLQPWHANVGKRLVKGPKVYIRDSGLLHSLLDIEAMDQLLGHPVAGNSWEGFVIENIINICSEHQFQPCFYRTHSGAEIDLLLIKGGVPKIAIEIKLSLAPKVERGFQVACDDLQVEQRFVVYSGKEAYLLSGNVQVISLEGLALKLAE
jgi:predicted AAA+ superfamily ATPase